MRKINQCKLAGIFIALSILCLTGSVAAQRKDFSGFWVLQKRKSLSGPDYNNGIPKQLTVSQTATAVHIAALNFNDQGDYIQEEHLAFDGRMDTSRRGDRRRICSMAWQGDTAFVKKVTNKTIDSGRVTSNFIETWHLQDPDHLVIYKRQEGLFTMEGVYYRTTPEALARDTAKGDGLVFSRLPNWTSVLAKARKEKKYIFVDCYTTWCAPCRQMDNDIYPVNKLGRLLNPSFVAVKIQMDSTAKDDAYVRSWRATANSMARDYSVSVYPSFLFFTPEGRLVHRGFGSLNVEEFLDLAADARDERKQYYTLLRSYQKGIYDAQQLITLAMTERMMEHGTQADKIILDLKKHYLDTMSFSALLTKEYMQLAAIYFPILFNKDGVKGRLFTLFTQYGKKIDGLLGVPGMASSFVETAVTRDEIDARLWNGDHPKSASPDWAGIQKNIADHYQVDAEKLVIGAQVAYYQKRKDWDHCIPSFIRLTEKLGLDRPGIDNMTMTIIGMHTLDTAILQKAAGWLETIIRNYANSPQPEYQYGTYGNYAGILYKLGRREEAMALLRKYLDYMQADIDKLVAEGKGDTIDHQFLDVKRAILEKMKKGIPIDDTWKVRDFF